MSLASIITWLYPDARPNIDWVVRDDGQGPFIHLWDEQAIGAPQPTVEEVLAHEDAWRLDTAKRAKIEAIDARSSQLLTAGLEIAEGVWISTSVEAQINLSDLYFGYLAGIVSLPQGLSTLDDGEYMIESGEELERIATLSRDRRLAVLDAGRALKRAVHDAESVEAVEAIVDDRE